PKPRKTGRLFSIPHKDLDFSAWFSENSYKILAILFLLTAVAGLFFRWNYPAGGDAAALACLQSAQPKPKFPHVNWKSVQRIVDKSTPFSSFRSEKWIVVSVADYASDSLKTMAKIKGWQLLAVGNSRTPKDWTLKGAIFLSLEMQAELGFRVTDFLPYDSYIRKTVGYLFAIQHGAQKIYDVDDRGDVIDNDIAKHFDIELVGEAARQETLLQYSHENPNRTVVNPYIHFGQRSVWPRGLPLENVGHIGHEEFYTEVFGGKQFIQQGISNGLPDVDSVFYFSRKAALEGFDISFDDRAPKVALPQGTMVPINSLNTLFHSPAFWGLMLPVSVSSMASDILRGYWAQRILWEIGGFVAVYPPTIHRYDRIEAYPFSEEKDLHVSVGRLIKFLVEWRSNQHRLFEKILELSYVMAEEKFWGERDLHFTAAWLQDLLAVGYNQPRLMSLELDRPRAMIGHGDRREFIPRKLPSVHLGVEEVGTVNYEIGNLIRWRKSFGNVVVVMFCSGPVERTALEWRLLYGRIFKTVIMLSENKDQDLAVEDAEVDYIYKYLTKFFDRYNSADGFLFLRDNTVLNYWNLLSADLSKLWITNKVSKSWYTVPTTTSDSDWFSKQLEMVKKVVATMPAHFQVRYNENAKDDKGLLLCNSEVFYVPRRLVPDLVDLVNLIGDLQVHHKAAIPMFFLSMDDPRNFDPVLDSMRYEEKLQSNWTCFYSADAPAVHPWNVSSSEKDFIGLVRLMAAGDPLLMELV
ncbi:hypothetical protein M569_09908, partial [Genlisea aurea]